MKTALLVIALCISSLAETGKIVDIQPFTQEDAPLITPNNGHPVLIDQSTKMFTITVAIGDMAYSGNYRVRRHLKSSDLVVGDPIEARVEGNKLIITEADGKEYKSTIIRRARL